MEVVNEVIRQVEVEAVSDMCDGDEATIWVSSGVVR